MALFTSWLPHCHLHYCSGFSGTSSLGARFLGPPPKQDRNLLCCSCCGLPGPVPTHSKGSPSVAGCICFLGASPDSHSGQALSVAGSVPPTLGVLTMFAMWLDE